MWVYIYSHDMLYMPCFQRVNDTNNQPFTRSQRHVHKHIHISHKIRLHTYKHKYIKVVFA